MFCFEISSFQKVLPSLGQVDQKKNKVASTVLITPGENIRAWPLGARVISFSYVSANIHNVPTMSHRVI